jgi:hypothetical protein
MKSPIPADLFATLKARFERNMHRHRGIAWEAVESRLNQNPSKLRALAAMEQTGGEPDVIAQPQTQAIVFIDCAAESPAGRRSLCFDEKARAARKENKPKGAALERAAEMGIELLNEAQYRALQELGEFDCKTSSWVQTPGAIRARGGALFCDRRYGQVFVYHNGAESYYAARGFRGRLEV